MSSSLTPNPQSLTPTIIPDDRLEQIVLRNSGTTFVNEVNALLTDGWRVLPGSFHWSTAAVVADPHLDRRYVNAEGITYRHTFFLTLWRVERPDPQALHRARAARGGNGEKGAGV